MGRAAAMDLVQWEAGAAKYFETPLLRRPQNASASCFSFD
jgi:hypothetical protein